MNEKVFFEEISKLDTEQINPETSQIDLLSTIDILRLINNEDKKVAIAVEQELPHIAKAVDIVSSAFKAGGRLIYFGAGTSGRLGVVDASECPPTFGVSREMVQGVIAGGEAAMFVAQEGAEDSEDGALAYFESLQITDKDVVCGIAASGRTPFVIGALKIAKSRNIKSIMVSTINRLNANHLEQLADVLICPYVGSEVIAGSTRMKSGTAQKLVLNMLTTASMVKIGKTYNNIMVDLQLTNNKLKERAKRILMNIAEIDYEKAVELLAETNGNVKTALLMALSGISKTEAEESLRVANGRIKQAEQNLKA